MTQWKDIKTAPPEIQASRADRLGSYVVKVGPMLDGSVAVVSHHPTKGHAIAWVHLSRPPLGDEQNGDDQQ